MILWIRLKLNTTRWNSSSQPETITDYSQIKELTAPKKNPVHTCLTNTTLSKIVGCQTIQARIHR